MMKEILCASLVAGMSILTACQPSKRNYEKDVINEVTTLIENWSYHNNPAIVEEDAEKYYTEDLLQTLHRSDSIYRVQNPGDEIGIIDFDPWSEGQDPDIKTKGTVTDVFDITDSTVTVQLSMTQWTQQIVKTLYLKNQNKEWRIDDMTIFPDEETTLRQFLHNGLK